MSTQFVKIPYKLLKYKGFKHKSADITRFVYVALQKHAKNNKVIIGMPALEKILGLTTRQVINHTNILIIHGFISRTHYTYSKDKRSKDIYKLHCPVDKDFAMVDHEIAYNNDINKADIIAYANIKRLTDLDKKDGKVTLNRECLATQLQCSINNADKIKRRLKEAGLIDYDSKTITLKWDLENFATAPKKSQRKQHVKKTIQTHTQEVSQNAPSDNEHGDKRHNKHNAQGIY